MLSADNKVFGLYNEFLGIFNEGGFQSHSRQFSDSVTTFRNVLDKTNWLVNVVCLDKPEAHKLAPLLNWLSGENQEQKATAGFPLSIDAKVDRIQFSINVDTFEAIQSKTTGSEPIVCDIIFISSELNESNEAEIAEFAAAISSEKAYTILCTGTKSKPADQLFRIVRSNALFAEQFTLDQLPEKKFTSRLQEPDFIQFIAACVNYQLISGIESFNKIVDLMVENEERSFKAKKALGQQQAIKIQSKSGPVISDVGTHIKGSITNQFSQLEKAISDSFEAFARPVTGDYSKLTDALADSLETFEETSKSKKKVLTIPKDFTTNYLAEIRKTILSQGHQHLIFMRDSIRETENEINNYCDKNGLPHVALNIKYLTDTNLVELLDSAIRIEKEYEGKMPQKGFYEYFMAMRKYQMIVLMLASTIGLGTAKQSLGLYMIPLSIILLGWGGYNVYKTVNQEAEELQEVELINAKDVLKTESKRIVGEVSRTWVRTISDHLRNQSNSTLTSIENSMKDYFSKRSMEDEEEKKKVQRQIQGVDNSERKLANLLRAKEAHLRNMSKAKSDFRQAISLTSKKAIA